MTNKTEQIYRPKQTEAWKCVRNLNSIRSRVMQSKSQGNLSFEDVKHFYTALRIELAFYRTLRRNLTSSGLDTAQFDSPIITSLKDIYGSFKGAGYTSRLRDEIIEGRKRRDGVLGKK